MNRIILIALALAGCASEADRAEREYEIVAKSGSSAEKCAALKKVTAAWLAEGNEIKYNNRKLDRDLTCNQADLDRISGDAS